MPFKKNFKKDHATLKRPTWAGCGTFDAIEKIGDTLGKEKSDRLYYAVDLLRSAVIAKNIYIRELETKIEKGSEEDDDDDDDNPMMTGPIGYDQIN